MSEKATTPQQQGQPGQQQQQGGGPPQFVEYGGIYLPPVCTKEHLEAMEKVQFRPDDILLCTFPKAGTHWFYEMMRMLMVGKAEPVKDIAMDRVALEFSFCNLEKLDELPSPRIFGTHLPLRLLPPNALASKCRLVVVERNVKDVAVSFFNMMKKISIIDFKLSWDSFVNNFIHGVGMCSYYFEHVKGFREGALDTSCPPICIFTYEDTKKDHVGQVARLSSFMGLSRSPQLFADIAALTSFKSMQKYKGEAELDEVTQKIFKTNKDEIYRKGEVGDWKNWFTVAQSEMFDAEYLKQMGKPFKM